MPRNHIVEEKKLVAQQLTRCQSLLWEAAAAACVRKLDLQIITRAGSSEGIFVESNGLGVTLDEVETDKAVDFLASVDWSQIEQWKLSLSSLDRSAYLYTDEASKLAKLIRAKANIEV